MLPITLRLLFSCTRTRFSRYYIMSALEQSPWLWQTYLLEFGLCLRHGDGCVPRSRLVFVKRAKPEQTSITKRVKDLTRIKIGGGLAIIARDDEVAVADGVFTMGSVASTMTSMFLLRILRLAQI